MHSSADLARQKAAKRTVSSQVLGLEQASIDAPLGAHERGGLAPQVELFGIEPQQFDATGGIRQDDGICSFGAYDRLYPPALERRESGCRGFGAIPGIDVDELEAFRVAGASAQSDQRRLVIAVSRFEPMQVSEPGRRLKCRIELEFPREIDGFASGALEVFRGP